VDEALACRDVLSPVTRRPNAAARFVDFLSKLIGRAYALLERTTGPAAVVKEEPDAR
jgi:hypothetical protein